MCKDYNMSRENEAELVVRYGPHGMILDIPGIVRGDDRRGVAHRNGAIHRGFGCAGCPMNGEPHSQCSAINSSKGVTEKYFEKVVPGGSSNYPIDPEYADSLTEDQKRFYLGESES